MYPSSFSLAVIRAASPLRLVPLRTWRVTLLFGRAFLVAEGLVLGDGERDSLGYFATRRDKAVVFSPSGKAAVTYRVVSGVMLAPMLQYAAGLRNGGQLVALAGGMTAAVFLVMATIATVSKRDFSFLGKFLFVGLILLIIASLANIFFQVPIASIAISAIAVMIFSLYLLYDVSAIVRGGQTNYIMATLALFLDIFNIFVNLLNLLLIFSGQRD